jgi:DNA-directed RNA polymerase subunit RPC12/RpoP
MRRTIIFVAIVNIFILHCSKVQTGTMTKCKFCHVEITNTIRTVQVPFWEAGKYSPVVHMTYCEKCGTQRVVYTVHYLCASCGQEFSSEKRFALRKEEKPDERITKPGAYCQHCSELVPYTIHYQCSRCGKEYSSTTMTAPRYEHKSDEFINRDFCSNACRNWNKVEEGVSKASEKTGDLLGRIGKGVSDGIMKHMR